MLWEADDDEEDVADEEAAAAAAVEMQRVAALAQLDGRANLDKQNDELLALQSIYGDAFVRDDGYGCMVLKVALEPADARTLSGPSELIPGQLTLRVSLPKGYPSHQCPVFSLFAPWLATPCLAVLATPTVTEHISCSVHCLFLDTASAADYRR